MKNLSFIILMGLSLLSIGSPARAATQAPWRAWARNPLDISVEFRATFNADASTAVNITLARQTVVGLGAGCGTGTATNGWGLLRPYQPSFLSVTGQNVGSTTIELIPAQPLDLRLATALNQRPIVPERYKIFVNGVATNLVSVVTTLCPGYGTNWTIELRPDNDIRRLNTAGRDDDTEVAEDVAPGDGDWLNMGPGKSLLTNNTGIKWSVGVGRMLSGKSAGRLHLMESSLGLNTYTPLGLFFFQPFTNQTDLPAAFRVEVLTNKLVSTASVIRQIKTPQAIADIQWDPAQTNGYEIRFFPASAVGSFVTASNFYNINSTTPFVTWRFTNTSGGSALTQLRLEEIRPNRIYTNELTFDTTNTWKLTRGDGSEKRIETRAIGFESGDRLETNEVRDATGTLTYRAMERYRSYGWGWELLSVATDTGSEVLTQTFDYYTSTGSINDYGKLKWTTHPDGFWEKRLYHSGTTYAFDGGAGYAIDGELAYILTPWNNSPASPTNAIIGDCHATHLWYRVNGTNGRRTTIVSKAPGGSTETNQYAVNNRILWLDSTDGVSRQTYGPMLMDCHAGDGAEQGTKRVIDEAPSLKAGQITQTLSDYSISETNIFEYGSYASGTFDPVGSTNAWRLTTVRGPGHINPQYTGGYDYCSVVPGKSTKELAIREQGVQALRELYIAYTNSGTGDTNFALVHKEYFTNDVLGRWTNYSRMATSSSRMIGRRDWQGSNGLPGGLLTSETDEDGRVKRYTYDSLKRVRTIELTGIGSIPSVVTTFSYDPMNRIIGVETNSGALLLSNGFKYDSAGRLQASTNEAGLVTSYSYPEKGRVRERILPSGATLVSSNYLSRKLWSETGTGTVPVYHDYSSVVGNNMCYGGAGSDFGQKGLIESQTVGTPNSGRTTEAVYNRWQLPLQDIAPGFASKQTNFYSYYTATSAASIVSYDSRVHKIASPDYNSSEQDNGRNRYFSYDPLRQIQHDWACPQGDCLGDLTTPAFANSSFRITTTERDFENSGDGCYHVTTVKVYLTNGVATPTILSITRERLSGFASNVKSEVITIDVQSRTNIQTTFVDSDTKKVTIVVTNSLSSLAATQIWVNGLLQSESTPTVSTPNEYSYDGLQRVTQMTNPLGGKSTTTYHSTSGQVIAQTDFAGNSTQYEYYANGQTGAGELKLVTRADGKKTYHSYNSRGQLTRIWGDVSYPEERTYNEFGEMTQLATYRDGSGWNGSTWPGSPGTPDITKWNYQTNSGLLLSKVDAASQTNSFTYWTNSALHTVTLARGVTATREYNFIGDLTQISFSDGTPQVTYSDYDRAGLPRTINDGGETHALLYDAANRLISDKITSGTWSGITVSNRFNPVGREAVALLQNATLLSEAKYGYDAYGRMGSVTSGVQTVSYAYKPASDRLQSTTSKHNGTTVLTTTRSWDPAHRLQSIANVAGSATIAAYQYLYDSVNRRTRNTREDSSIWVYGYNDRDEVTLGRRYWPDWAPVSGQQFEYTYDNIGNRATANSGGDTSGLNLRSATYTANAQNQYSSVTTPTQEDIVGVALATNSVTVNSGAADRKGEYFHHEITVGNGSAPVWQPTTITAGSYTTNCGFVSPKSSQSYVYDLDGNLTFDGVWLYGWDGENRLVEMVMTNVTSIPTNYVQRIQFTHDFQGRRITKTTTTWNGSVSTTRFIYDGWNLIAELDGSANVLRSYAWGQDVSRSMDGAAGTGGLLVITNAASGTNYFAAYDGNANVTALVAQNGDVSARYEYGPFGEPIRLSGPFAKTNPFRWSTKFTDEESGFAYYGKRFYSPSLGKWLSRDPIEEEGGLNLYAFVANNPLNSIDPFGANTLEEEEVVVGTGAELAALGAGAIGALTLATVKTAVANWNLNQFIVSSLESDMDDFQFAEAVQSASVDFSADLKGITVPDSFAAKWSDDTPVSEILKTKKGLIQNAPLPPDGPDWNTIRNMTWAAIVAGAKEGKAGYRTIKKLLTDGRFDK